MTKFKKSITAIVIILIVSALLFAAQTFINPYWGSVSPAGPTKSPDADLTYEEAKNDLDYMMKYLGKVHPACIGSIPEKITAAYESEIGRLPDRTSVVGLWQAASRILSVLGDSHTSVYPVFEQHYMLYTKENRDLHYTLTAVNGIDTDDLFESNKNLYSYELESWGRYLFGNHLSSKEGLAFLGIGIEDGAEFTYTDAQGNSVSFTYSDDDFVTVAEYIKYYADRNISLASGRPFVSYEIDGDAGVAVLTLDECNYNEEYRTCLKEFFGDVKQAGIAAIIVDLRSNGGGSSLVINEFIRYLDADSYLVDTYNTRLGPFMLRHKNGVIKNKKFSNLVFRGDVYIACSAATFSSAMMFAMYISDNDLGTVVGETPANMPDAYGDISTFRMPHSGLYFTVSFKEFFRADKSKAGDPVIPDIECGADDAIGIIKEMIKKKQRTQ